MLVGYFVAQSQSYDLRLKMQNKSVFFVPRLPAQRNNNSKDEQMLRRLSLQPPRDIVYLQNRTLQNYSFV